MGNISKIDEIDNSDPLTFVSTIKKGNHLLMLYENIERANELRLEFIRTGLKKNEYGIYLTTEEDSKSFEKSLFKTKTQLQKFKKNKKIQTYKIDNPFKNGGFGKSINKILKKINQNARSPMRIACNIVGDFGLLNKKEIQDLFATERCVNNNIKESENYVLCTYFTGDISNNTSGNFLGSIKKHTGVIFIPKNNPGIAFLT